MNLGRLLGLALVATFVSLALGVVSEFADKSVQVGDSTNPAGLSRAIFGAYAYGARNITVAKGVYVLPDISGSFRTLNGWTGVAIKGDGVTLIASGLVGCIFDMQQCKSVILTEFALSQIEVAFRQGKVTSTDPENGSPGS